MLKITVLGSGTSSGVPVIGCKCNTCSSINPKDKRTRSSIMIENEDTKVIVDTSSDFRYQMLKHNICTVDGIIFTHHHFDHIGGFDDLRAFNLHGNLVNIYTNEVTLSHLKRVFEYAFNIPDQIGGGVPNVICNQNESQKFKIKGLEFSPIEVLHGNLPILGFRVNNFAYITDASFISDESMSQLKGLDVLILNALRYKVHSTHFNVDQAIDIIKFLKPKQAYLTHIAHDIMHEDLEEKLPKNIRIAYDGMKIEC